MISLRASLLVWFLATPNKSIINAEDASFLRHPTKIKDENDAVELATATASFIQHHNLKSDTNLDIHDFSLGQDSFHVNGKKYFLNDLERKEIYAEDATFSLNGKELMKLDNKESSIFVGQQNGDQIMVERNNNSDAKGQVESIVILPENGPEIYMESIKPNVLAVIKPEDLLPEYAEILAKLELKGRYADEDENHKLSANFNCEQTMLSKDHQVKLGNGLTCSKYYLMTVAIEFDSSFCQLSGGKWGKTKTKIEAIVANASARYEKQGICTKILISNLGGHCNGSTDPYADMVNKATDLGCRDNRAGLLTEFATFFKKRKNDVQRCASHLFFGMEPKSKVIGCAEIDRLCPQFESYAVINMHHFKTVGQRGILFAHELGHNVGLHHSSNSFVNPRLIMRPNPGEGGGSYKFSRKNKYCIPYVLEKYWSKSNYGACVKIEPASSEDHSTVVEVLDA